MIREFSRWIAGVVAGVACAVSVSGVVAIEAPATAETWAKVADATPSDKLDGWTKAGHAPAEEGRIVTRSDRKWLLLDPSAPQGSTSILEIRRKSTVQLGTGVEARVEINFVDSKPATRTGDVLVMLQSPDARQRYQLNIGPNHLMFGSMRYGKFTARPSIAPAVGSPGTPIVLRLRLEVGEGQSHVLSAFVGDSKSPVGQITYAANDTDPATTPLTLDEGIRLAVGVQNGFAAEFTAIDLQPIQP